MPQIVIVAYRPKPDCEEALLRLVHEHVPRLRAYGFVTGRVPHIMRASDGVIVEVFEWTDDGIELAHADHRVATLWAEFAAVCDYVPLKDLAECAQLFASFAPA